MSPNISSLLTAAALAAPDPALALRAVMKIARPRHPVATQERAAPAGLTRSAETSQPSTPTGQLSRARLIASERTMAHGHERKTSTAFPTAAGFHY